MTANTSGHIQLGLLAEGMPGALILSLVPAFRASYPQIRVTVRYSSLDRIEEELIADRMNFALVFEPRASDFMQSVSCGALDFIAVASKNYVERRGPFDREEQILLADWIDLDEHMPLVSRWVGASDKNLSGILGHVKPAVAVPNFHTALELMLAGTGVAFLPRQMVAEPLHSGRAVELKVAGQIPPKPLNLLYRRRNTRQLYESLFLEHVLDNLPLNGDRQRSAG